MVDLGEGRLRQIFAGLRAYYPDPARARRQAGGRGRQPEAAADEVRPVRRHGPRGAAGGDRPHRLATFDGAEPMRRSPATRVTLMPVPHPLRAQPDGLPAHRRRAHGAVQLALRARRCGGKYVLRIDDTDQQRNVEAALAPILHGFQLARAGVGRRPEVGGPHAPYFQSQRGRALPGRGRRAGRAAAPPTATTPAPRRWTPSARRPRREAAVPVQPPLHGRHRRRSSARSRAKDASAVVRLKMPREGTLDARTICARRGRVRVGAGGRPRHPARRRLVHLSPGQRGRRSRLRASRTSSAPRSTCRTRRARCSSSRRSAIRCRPTRTCPTSPSRARSASCRSASSTQYLKNPDFEKVHEHGTADRAAMRCRSRPRRSTRSSSTSTSRSATCPTRSSTTWCCSAGRSTTRPSCSRATQMVRELLARAGATRRRPASIRRSCSRSRCTTCSELPLDEKVAARAAVPRARRAGRAPVRRRARSGRAIVEALGDRHQGVRRHPAAGRVLLRRRSAVVRREGVRQARAGAGRRRASCATIAPGWRRVDAPTASTRARALEQATHAWLGERGWALGDIVHAVRVAVTGVGGGPGLFDCLALLGRDRCLARIDRALQKAVATRVVTAPAHCLAYRVPAVSALYRRAACLSPDGGTPWPPDRAQRALVRRVAALRREVQRRRAHRRRRLLAGRRVRLRDSRGAHT